MTKSNWVKSFFFYYFPILLWMGLIFCLSSIKGNGFHGEADFWFYAKRKGAHVFEYIVLTVLIARPVLKAMKRKKEFLKRVVLIGELSLLYAVSDEAHQMFVLGREGKVLDIAIDLVGILFVTFLIFKLYYKNKHLKKFFLDL